MSVTAGTCRIRSRFVLFGLVVGMLALLAGTAYGAAPLPLKLGKKGPQVVQVQHALVKSGFRSQSPTGIFDSATKSQVKRFQSAKGLSADGVVGDATWDRLMRSLRDRMAASATASNANGTGGAVGKHKVGKGETLWGIAKRYGTTVTAVARANRLKDPSAIKEGSLLLIPGQSGVSSRGSRPSPPVELIDWEKADALYAPDTIATVTDIRTGLSFKVRRYFGHLHADSEPLTAADTAVMRKIYGRWTWDRRAIVLTVGGRRFAASMNGMPHGQGEVKGNGFDGHFCIHFLGSRTHASRSMDDLHQRMILSALGYKVTHLWTSR